jgi:hypothetical protein
MAFGFPAYSEDSVRFRGASSSRLLRAAEDALEDLGWRPTRTAKWRLQAAVPVSVHVIFVTWGAKFIVDIEDEWLHLRSEGSIPIAWVDLGQHRSNIDRFLNRFEDLLERDTARD